MRNFKKSGFIKNKSLNIFLRFFLSSFIVISFFYVAPVIINFTDKNFNNKEFTNNSKNILNNKLNEDKILEEDSNVNTDANFVLNQDNEIIEIQVSAEKKPFSYKNFEELFQLSKKGIQELLNFQKRAIEDEHFS